MSEWKEVLKRIASDDKSEKALFEYEFMLPIGENLTTMNVLESPH